MTYDNLCLCSFVDDSCDQFEREDMQLYNEEINGLVLV